MAQISGGTIISWISTSTPLPPLVACPYVRFEDIMPD
jgi:hypothetical protein